MVANAHVAAQNTDNPFEPSGARTATANSPSISTLPYPRPSSIHQHDPDPDLSEPPPAYTAAPATGQAVVDAGPSHMDFSGPPPISDRMQGTMTGQSHSHGAGQAQGHGYGHAYGGGQGGVHVNPQYTGYLSEPGNGSWQTPQHTGGGYGNQAHHTIQTGASGSYPGFPPPPQRPSQTGSYGSPPPQPPTNQRQPSHSQPHGQAQSSASSQAGVPDLSPAESPVPGRPLLHRKMLLVYPKGHFCHKCELTNGSSSHTSQCLDVEAGRTPG
jgi:hypothetical protein